jgi:tetratricopeptide (TPR) repeat protein
VPDFRFRRSILKIIKGFFAFTFLLFFFTSELYAQDDSQYYPKPEKKSESCKKTLRESYKTVYKGRFFASQGNYKKAEEYFKNHLKCWDDKPVAIELAAIYENSKRYYLAGEVLKEAGLTELYERVEKLRIIGNTDEFIASTRDLFKEKSDDYEKAYKKKKEAAILLTTFGMISFFTGFGLFLHDKGFEGKNSLSAQYILMYSGFTMIGSGLILNTRKEQDLAYRNVYKDLYSGNISSTDILDDDYITMITDNTVKAKTVKEMRANGLGLMLLSIPMYIISVFAIYETIDFVRNNQPILPVGNLVIGIVYYFNRLWVVPFTSAVLTIFPATLFLTLGIKNLIRADHGENLLKKQPPVILETVVPFFDPFNKTFGLSAGFSF